MNINVLEARKLANQIMLHPEHVFLQQKSIETLAKFIKSKLLVTSATSGILPPIRMSEDENVKNKQIILYELMANAINYKYWYGKHYLRPFESSSTKMYDILNCSINEIVIPMNITHEYIRHTVDNFIRHLCSARFPMIKERIQHLEEIKESEYFISNFDFNDIDKNMSSLLQYFPGFGQDMFLKRACLFFIMLYRQMGWFKNQIQELVIPVDYQVPKMFHCYNCFDYSDLLSQKINSGELIQEESLMELEIRSATIVAADIICQKENINIVNVDAFLWGNRKASTDPFHLTITTNY